MKFVLSYSGGKDSMLALYRLVSQGHQPVALLTTVNPEQNRSWFHGIPVALLEAAAHSVKIPLLLCPCAGEAYGPSIEAGLKDAAARGATAAVFGDIDIEDHRQWNRDRCSAVGLECILPLWGQDREALTREFMAQGFSALINLVQKEFLDDSFLGKTLTPAVIADIKPPAPMPAGKMANTIPLSTTGRCFTIRSPWPKPASLIGNPCRAGHRLPICPLKEQGPFRNGAV